MASFADHYFHTSAPSTPPPLPAGVAALHLNEMPYDIPDELRRRINRRLADLSYNRYPEPTAASLAGGLARYYGCRSDQLLVGPGSSAFIRLLLTYFGLHMDGRLVITRPSFAYYEQFCQAFGIAYDTWELDDEFRYDIGRLGDLPDYSVVCLTTPNNPTGSVLPAGQLETLLTRYPRSLFVVDEAYAEFSGQAMLALSDRFDNLLLLRTLSKAFGIAGIRCGSLIGNAGLVASIAQLQTPWQLAAPTIEAANVALEFYAQTDWITRRVGEVAAERDRLAAACRTVADQTVTVYPSKANFIMMRAASDELHARLLSACAAQRVRIGNLDHLPRLKNCVRVTIGTPEEDELFYKAFQQAIITS